MNIKLAQALIKNEYKQATTKFGSFNSTHKGYAVIKEELDEPWDSIKTMKMWNNLKERQSKLAQWQCGF